MKIAIAGAWHRDVAWGLRVIDAAHTAGCQFLLHTGDLGIGMPPGESDAAPYEEALDARLDEHGMEMLFCRGNDDNFDVLRDLPFHPEGGRKLTGRIRMLDGDFVTLTDGYGSVTVAGLGGGASPDWPERLQREENIGVSRTIYWPEEVVSRFAARRLMEENAGRRVDILISHEGPIEAYQSGKLSFLASQDLFYRPAAESDAIVISAVGKQLLPKAHFFGHPQQRVSLWDGQSDHIEYLESLAAEGSLKGNVVVYDSCSEHVKTLEMGLSNG